MKSSGLLQAVKKPDERSRRIFFRAVHSSKHLLLSQIVTAAQDSYCFGIRVALTALWEYVQRIKRPNEKGNHLECAAILQEAKQEGYGTIVMGKKGLSKVEEFSMGRVCQKVVELAKNKAVWVVNQNRE